MKSRQHELPVYCIDTFRKGSIAQPADFDIKELETLVNDFHFTSQPHRHDFYNLLFVSRGSGNHTIDFVTFEIQPCSIFFLTPGQVHSLNLLSDDVQGFSIFFTPQFYLMDSSEKKILDVPFFHSLINQPYLYMDCLKDESIRMAIQEISAEHKGAKPGSNSIIRSYLDIIITKLTRYYKQSWASQQSSTITYQIRELEALVERNFRTLKLPRDYADKMNLSPKHLNEICKKGLNKTAGDLIQERLLLEIKRLLAYTPKNISEIADELNFSDKSYFIRFFKKHTNTTPEQFRSGLLG